MTGKISLYFSLYPNYHVIEYSYKLTNFYEMLKSTVDTPFEPKKKETSATTKHLRNSRIISGIIVVVMMTLSCKNVSRQTLTTYDRVTSLYHS